MEHSFYMQEGWLGSYVRLGFLGAAYLTGYVRFDDFGNREIGGYDLVNFRRVFLASRLVSVLAGLATVGLIYLIGALHWSKLCGLLAGLVLAIVPGHVVLSHFAKSNALAALLATASLYFALVWQREPSRGAALLAGVFAGLAGGARINAVLSIVGFGLALILRWRALKGASRVSTVMLALVGMLAALAICYPHLIARPSLPDYGVGTIWFAGFNWNVLGQALWLIFGGWPGIVLLLLGLVLSGAQVLGQRDTSCIIVLGWSALYCIFVAKTKVPQPRYFMPILPALALLTAVGITWGLENIPLRGVRWAVGSVALALLLLTFAFSVAYVNVFRAEDTKVTAGRWLASNAPPGSIIGKACWEGDHRVPVDTRLHEVVYSQPHPDRDDIRVMDESDDQPQPDFVIVPEEHVALNQFRMEEYDLATTIERPLTGFGLRFDDRFATTDPYAPRWYSKFHDTVYIYRHR